VNWGIYLILAALMWALHTGAIKVAGEKIPAAQVTFLFYIFAVLTTLVILLLSRSRPDLAVIVQDKKLLAAIALAGITIGLTDYFFLRGLALGAPLSVYAPLFSTVGLGIIALIGVFYFGEAFTLTKLVGFAFAAVGIFLLAR